MLTSLSQHKQNSLYADICRNHVPPIGRTDLLLGSNPIAISAPSGSEDPFILDMANTVAAMGKIKVLTQQGKPMPEAWMIGHDGKPLTDPNRKSDGFLLPIGRTKGFGLSVAIGLMAGVLNGAVFGSDVVDFTNNTNSETNIGQYVMALDIAVVGMSKDFGTKAAHEFKEMRDSTPLPDFEPVRLQGVGKAAMVAERRELGLNISPDLPRDLSSLIFTRALIYAEPE